MFSFCLIHNTCRADEHKVGVLQRLESAGEHILLQPPIKTSDWTDALQQPTVSRQVRPFGVFYSLAFLVL